MDNTTTTLNDFIENKVRFYSFSLVSKKSGRSYPMEMFGTDRDEARERLLDGWCKNQNWNRWTLTDN